MLLTSGTLRVALATTHLPLKDVSAAISIELICEVLEILHRDLTRRWGFTAPRIAVCGLNPHAGEGGHMGDEEVRVITPAIERMRVRGIAAHGPVPADTIFVPHILANYDAVLAMYHDQGLPVVKHVGFQSAVNVTLGLPIVRTSVDHGTALELAGSGRADHGSFTAAVARGAAPGCAAPGKLRQPVRPRKRFGQHFLHDPAVIRRIVQAVAPQAGGHLVEIGPGRGAMTQLLLESHGALDAIEIDRDLAALLREKFAHLSGFVLHEADALDFDFAALARACGARLRIVGNLPYNISTPLLFHLLASSAVIADMHVMLQREVVDRLVARPGAATTGVSP